MQNSSENDDLRVRRTRTSIQTALINLTVEKGFAAVTVRDICERAMINRSTFYRHYLDKYAVLEQHLAEVKQSMTQAYQEQMSGAITSSKPAGLMAFLRHIQSFPDFYRVMLGAEGDARFIQHFRTMIENHFRMMLAEETPPPDTPPLDLRLSYVSGADVAAILWWLEDGQGCSLEEFSTWIGQITRFGVRLLQRHEVGQS